jgi:hypothetical protein
MNRRTSKTFVWCLRARFSSLGNVLLRFAREYLRRTPKEARHNDPCRASFAAIFDPKRFYFRLEATNSQLITSKNFSTYSGRLFR